MVIITVVFIIFATTAADAATAGVKLSLYWNTKNPEVTESLSILIITKLS